MPILRAGVGMLDGVSAMIPVARVGFLGMYRDEETLQPVVYYSKLPSELSEREILLLDPMLATGGSAVDAVRHLQGAGRPVGAAAVDHRGARGHRGAARRAPRRRRSTAPPSTAS